MPTRNALFPLVLVLLLAGCAPNAQRPSLSELLSEAQVTAAEAAESAREDGSGAASDHDHASHGHDDESNTDEPNTDEPNTHEPNTDEPDIGTAGTEPAPASPAPAASSAPGGPTLEQYSDFPIGVTLSPLCVEQGKEMKITVETGRRDSGVVYIAFYAGEESGGPPPYGDGHGGNSGDMSDSKGRYQDTWVVSPTAPVGQARAEVMAGQGGMKSTALVRFEVVARGSGGCD